MLAVVALAAGATAGSLAGRAEGAVRAAAAAGPAAGNPHSGAILFKLRPDAAPAAVAQLNALLRQYDVREDRRVVKGRVSCSRARGPQAPAPETLCEELLETDAVDFAEPDRLIAPDALPDDPKYTSQWFQTKIDSPGAWDVTVGSPSVIVAVCDTGVDSGHPDLAPNLVLPGYNSADGSTDTEPVMWHGTAVAGCIGAVGNNGLGVAGVNWTVSILPVRVSNRSDGAAYTSDIAEGITWAADQGARVVNVSYDASSSAAVDYAGQYLLGAGGVLFIAAGNSGVDTSSICPPSPNSMVVGATTSSDALASWSNYGAGVDLVAPGSGIYTTYAGGGYASVSGTSFASPIAAGVAALVFAENPSLDPSQVMDILCSTCTDLGASGPDDAFGYGRVDSAAAVAVAAGATPETPPDQPPDAPPTAQISASSISGEAPLTVTFDGTGSSDSDGSIVSYAWDFGDGSRAQGAVVTHRYASAGTFTAALTVTDDGGLTDEATCVIVVAAPTATPVHVGSIDMGSSGNKKGGEQATASVLVLDAKGKAVPGATVSGVWSGIVTGSDTATTSSRGKHQGVATFKSSKTRASGTAVFTVTDITGSGLTYDPTANVATSGSVVLSTR